jgi:hypothetical protein
MNLATVADTVSPEVVDIVLPHPFEIVTAVVNPELIALSHAAL